MIKSRDSLRHIVFLALLSAIAIALSIAERFIPMSFIAPGVKLGLANSMSLICLYIYGLRDALGVFFIRVFVVALLFGGLSSLMYSLTGGFLSIMAMYLCITLLQDRISPIGTSVVGAFFHNLGQVLVLGFVADNFFIAGQWFPLLTYLSILTGGAVGILAMQVIRYQSIRDK